MNTTGTLPNRYNTVLGEVLVSMLAGATLTHRDPLSAFSTMRMAHHTHAIKKDFGWQVVTGDRVVGCLNGRTQTIAGDSLPQSCIEAIDTVISETYIRYVDQPLAGHALHKGKFGEIEGGKTSINPYANFWMLLCTQLELV